jgi:threonine dehydrogenase-like Zn-dependent dehydrogenase
MRGEVVEMTDVVVVIGAGLIGQAIARRVGVAKHVLLADMREENAGAAQATSLGDVRGLIHAAGVSPSQASPETVLKVDLYGTALVLEEFGNVVAPGGSGVVIASQSGHAWPSPRTNEQVTGCARGFGHP